MKINRLLFYIIFITFSTGNILMTSCSGSDSDVTDGTDTSVDPSENTSDETTTDTDSSEEVVESQRIYISTQEDFDEYKNHEFSAGDTILFKSGASFVGQFSPKGSGTTNYPIVVAAYDSETNEPLFEDIDDKPIINGQGLPDVDDDDELGTFYLYNEDNWIISNLEITNTDGTDDDQGKLCGILIRAKDIGTAENFTVRYCYIHDVNGEVADKYRGGIEFKVSGSTQSTIFDNVLIEYNVVSYVGGIGIENKTSWGKLDEDDYYPWTNYIIRGNRVDHTGKNGIIVRNCISPIIEYNILNRTSMYDTGNSMFNCNTKYAVMQYNEVYGNTGDIDDHERGGFDADNISENTTIQYNYSHGNHWFCAMMCKENYGITIRYNVSVNDLVAVYNYGFPNKNKISDVLIYNNTSYFKSGINATIFSNKGDTERTPKETKIYNNIFYFEDPTTWAVTPNSTCELSHNLFYNIPEIGSDNITSDPMFVNKGDCPSDIDMTSNSRLSSYQLDDGSPCIDSGKTIEDNGGIDFAGNLLSDSKTDIGAFEKQ